MKRSPPSDFDYPVFHSSRLEPDGGDAWNAAPDVSISPERSPTIQPSDPESHHDSAPMPSPPPSSPEQDSGLWPVLRNRDFLMMWIGQVFSQLADKVYLVLMISIIANHFQAPGQSISGWVSAIMIAFTIPAILFGSIAGVFVDRWSKKAVLTGSNLLRAGLVFLLPALLALVEPGTQVSQIPVGFLVLLLITFLVSTLTQFFAPAEQATLPLIVPPRQLLSANSLYTTTMMASVIIGFAIGEPLLEFAGQWMESLGAIAGLDTEGGKEVIVGLGYGIAGLLLLWLNTHEAAIDPDREHPHVWQDIRDGIRYLGKNDRVRAALIQLVLLFSVFAALAVLAVRLAEVIPTIQSDQFGFLLAAGGVGLAIGATVIGQFGQTMSRARLSLYGSLGMAIALSTLALFTQQLLPTLIIIGLLGGFAAIIAVPMQTTIQAETPENMRGKVFGLQNNAVNIALSLPLALASIAESALGLQIVFVGLGGMVAMGGVLTWYISRKGSIKTSS
ncbi:MAG: MFS transporter [Leptolyngbya sp. DLM2.Bin15]|nr:MAG: MFS transporter [Leptolyngbya sp. DLM2.Bin15]